MVKDRILNALPEIISKVQSCFQASKSSVDNILVMRLILKHFNNYLKITLLALLQLDLWTLAMIICSTMSRMVYYFVWASIARILLYMGDTKTLAKLL